MLDFLPVIIIVSTYDARYHGGKFKPQLTFHVCNVIIYFIPGIYHQYISSIYLQH